jgi:hypothetical protein
MNRFHEQNPLFRMSKPLSRKVTARPPANYNDIVHICLPCAVSGKHRSPNPMRRFKEMNFFKTDSRF